MIGVIILGILLIAFGLFSVIKGKIPFIKEYNGVKKIALHSRIEGSAALLVGILFVLQYFIPMKAVSLIIIIFVICILTLILELVSKAI